MSSLTIQHILPHPQSQELGQPTHSCGLRGRAFCLLFWFKSFFQAQPDQNWQPRYSPFSLHSLGQSFQYLQGFSEDGASRGPGPLSGRSPGSDIPSVFTLDSLKHRVTKNCPRGIVGWQGVSPTIQNFKPIIKTSTLFPFLQALADTDHNLMQS